MGVYYLHLCVCLCVGGGEVGAVVTSVFSRKQPTRLLWLAYLALYITQSVCLSHNTETKTRIAHNARTNTQTKACARRHAHTHTHTQINWHTNSSQISTRYNIQHKNSSKSVWQILYHQCSDAVFRYWSVRVKQYSLCISISNNIGQCQASWCRPLNYHLSPD